MAFRGTNGFFKTCVFKENGSYYLMIWWK